MCNECSNNTYEPTALINDRRRFLKTGAVLAVAPFIGGIASKVQAAPAQETIGNGPYPTDAYGVSKASGPIESLQIQRRSLGPYDVLIDILYCAICHTDIHYIHNDWGISRYPCIPGHEIIGKIQKAGNAVTKFKVGDIVGVGTMVDADLTCENCLADREQNCLSGTTFTYNSPDPVSGGHTFGGYSKKIVVKEHFVIRIPPGTDLPAMAPLLCAGITTFSPMRYWKVGPGQRVGVLGLGGLGHMAVKLGVAHRADVVVFTTTPGKLADAQKMGAKDAVLWSDDAGMKRYRNTFDLIISTVPKVYPMQPFIDLLKLDATLVNVGASGDLQGVSGRSLIFGRKNIAGSVVGGIAETQQVVDFCAARNIKADIELIRPDQINEALHRVVNKDVRYRFVVDMNA